MSLERVWSLLSVEELGQALGEDNRNYCRFAKGLDRPPTDEEAILHYWNNTGIRQPFKPILFEVFEMLEIVPTIPMVRTAEQMQAA